MRPARASATLAFAAAILSGSAWAQEGRSLKQGPDELLDQINIEQRLDAQLPVELEFENADGETIKLGDVYGDKPVILALVYYECPMLCTMVLNGALRAVNVIDELNVGRDFDILAVSIDHRETSLLAQEKKALYQDMVTK